jgi:hypothetical protein
MKFTLTWIGCLLAYVLTYYAVQLYSQKNGIGYDCRLAEISPDFPPKAKQKCRELIGEHKNR